jgi:hypothetical protein
MKGRVNGMLGVLGALSVVAVGAASAYAVSSAFDDSAPSSDAAQGTPATVEAIATPVPEGGIEGGRWRAVGRDRLALCLAAVLDPNEIVASDSLPTSAMTTVASTLEGLKNEPIWDQYNEGYPDPIVDEGCPGTPSLYDPEAGPYISQTFFHVRGRSVTEASYYRLHIYILPQEEIDKYDPPPRFWRFTSEEFFCEADSCSAVTGGLYVSASELEDSEFFTNLLAIAIGVR